MVVKDIEQNGNQLLLTVDIPEVKEKDHTIYLAIDAIGSRMVMYNLKTPQEAVEAIMREHARRMNPDLDDPTNREEAVQIMEKDVDAITVDIKCQKLLDDTLDENLDRIRFAIMERVYEPDA